MKLIGSSTSPYVRKVRVVLAEKKIEYEFIEDSPWLESNKISEYNPLGKVPVLLIDDDKPLFDSRVIVEYLDNVAPNAKLIPVSNRERSENKRWEALADGICDAAVAILLEKKRESNQQSSDWISRQQNKLDLALKFMAQQAQEPYLMGNHFSLADIAVGCCLDYLCFRFPEMDWRTQFENLNNLYSKLMLRSSFQDTKPVVV